MPARDTARDSAFSTITNTRTRILDFCREVSITVSPDASQTMVSGVTAILAEHGFEIERDFGNVPGAFRATRFNHDSEAMRKGLRHAHVGLLTLLPGTLANDSSAEYASGAGAVIAAAVGLAATLTAEHATVTMLGVPDDVDSARSIAATGVFEETDVLFGARPVAPGAGFCYTITGTGDRLASLTVRLNHDPRSIDWESTRASLGELESIEAGDDNTIVVMAPTLPRALAIVESPFIPATGMNGHGDPLEVISRTGEMLVSRILARRVKTYGDNLGFQMDKIRKLPPEMPSIWNNISHIVPAYELAFSAGSGSDADTAHDPAIELTDDWLEQMTRAGECLCFAGLDVIRDESFRAIADDQLIKALRERGVERPHRRWLGVHPVLPKPDGEGAPKRKGPHLKDFSIISGPGLPNPLLRNDN